MLKKLFLVLLGFSSISRENLLEKGELLQTDDAFVRELLETHLSHTPRLKHLIQLIWEYSQLGFVS